MSYSIISGNTGSAFVLDANTGLLQVNAALDHETTNAYQLTIQLEDGGTPSLSSTVSVDITILDVNDNEPAFGTSFNFHVDENSPVDTVIGVITATDADSGTNGEMEYAITSTSGGDNSVFKVGVLIMIRVNGTAYKIWDGICILLICKRFLISEHVQ